MRVYSINVAAPLTNTANAKGTHQDAFDLIESLGFEIVEHWDSEDDEQQVRQINVKPPDTDVVTTITMSRDNDSWYIRGQLATEQGVGLDQLKQTLANPYWFY